MFNIPQSTFLKGTKPPSKDGSSSRAGEAEDLNRALPSSAFSFSQCQSFFGLLPMLPRLARPTALELEMHFLSFSFPDVVAICATPKVLQSKLLIPVEQISPGISHF